MKLFFLKTFILLSVFWLSLMPVHAQKLVFAEKEHNFGDVYDGDILNYSFYFTNTSDIPAIVSKVTQSCGCVLSLYPRQPILKGDTVLITLKFNTNGKKGKQTKRIEVYSNDPRSPGKLTLKANVLPRSERKKKNTN